MSILRFIKEISKKILISKKVLSSIIFAIIPAGLFYSFSFLGLKFAGFNIIQIIRDPAQQSGASSFLGFLSNIGVWLWISSAAICLHTASTCYIRLFKRYKELVILLGFLSLILAIDDFFLIHDRFINEKICYLGYAIIIGALLARHFSLIIEIQGFAFIAACSLLMLSILTDLIQSRIPIHYEYTQIFEEGFKFIGIATWLYFVSTVASFNPTSSNNRDFNLTEVWKHRNYLDK